MILLVVRLVTGWRRCLFFGSAGAFFRLAAPHAIPLVPRALSTIPVVPVNLSSSSRPRLPLFPRLIFLWMCCLFFVGCLVEVPFLSSCRLLGEVMGISLLMWCCKMVLVFCADFFLYVFCWLLGSRGGARDVLYLVVRKVIGVWCIF